MSVEQNTGTGVATIRQCAPADQTTILRIINAAAEAYRGVIPADRWHDPYMSEVALADEIADGVLFSCYVLDGDLVGVMGMQRRHNVDLIRHAYVLPAFQGRGIGAVLLAELCEHGARPIFIGTWRAAEWAIRFYQRHGFAFVNNEDIAPLLQTYWKVPQRQIATSVVLAKPPLTKESAASLLAAAT